jgi:hypothetical protein
LLSQAQSGTARASSASGIKRTDRRWRLGHEGFLRQIGSLRDLYQGLYEHGLDQEFNSLDAQYEAASAYIKSQAHAGWTLIRSRYDDGGYSGADHYAVFTTFADFDRAVECFRGSVAQITATLARSCAI